MSTWQLWIVGIIYAYTGLKLGFVHGDWPMALVWVSYALANTGLILAMKV